MSMKNKNYVLLLFLFQLILSTTGNCQLHNKLSYDFNVGIKQPIIKGKVVRDVVENCGGFHRKTAAQFDQQPIYARLFVSFEVAKNFKNWNRIRNKLYQKRRV